jgi:hypothetical protein
MAAGRHIAKEVEEHDAKRDQYRQNNAQQDEPQKQAELEEAPRLFAIESPSGPNLPRLAHKAMKKGEAEPGNQITDHDADGEDCQDGKRNEN